MWRSPQIAPQKMLGEKATQHIPVIGLYANKPLYPMALKTYCYKISIISPFLPFHVHLISQIHKVFLSKDRFYKSISVHTHSKNLYLYSAVNTTPDIHSISAIFFFRPFPSLLKVWSWAYSCLLVGLNLNGLIYGIMIMILARDVHWIRNYTHTTQKTLATLHDIIAYLKKKNDERIRFT